MSKIAVFPGSFDPITLGHESIVSRATKIFDRIIVAIGHNSSKTGFFTIEQRLDMANRTFAGLNNVEVRDYSGLTVDFCKEVGAGFIIRGLRSSIDFEFENSIAQMNKLLIPNIETLFLLSELELSPVSSTIIRDIYRNGGDISAFVPKVIIPLVGEQWGE